jgi:hypothetical protein
VAIPLALVALALARAADPLPVAGRIGPTASGTTLWLDAESRAPTALLTDPSGRLPTESRSLVLQTIDASPISPGFRHLEVADAFPEFWAQPAVWEVFLKGPGAFSGLGRELQARDWAGRRTTDRRAYALDPGLERSWTLSAVAPPGVGLVTPGLGQGSLRLSWSGLAGRVYRIDRALTLARPFQELQTLIAAEDGSLTLDLAFDGSEGFYRVAEIEP